MLPLRLDSKRTSTSSILSERVRELQKTVASQVDVALEALGACSCDLIPVAYLLVNDHAPAFLPLENA